MESYLKNKKGIKKKQQDTLDKEDYNSYFKNLIRWYLYRNYFTVMLNLMYYVVYLKVCGKYCWSGLTYKADFCKTDLSQSQCNYPL